MLGLAGASVCADSHEVKYKAAIKGVGRGAVEKSIKESALTFRLEKRPPATLGQLRRRVDKDLPLIEQILESQGYYDRTVAAEINTAEHPHRVLFTVDSGEQYRYRTIELRFKGPGDASFRKIVSRIRSGQRAVAENLFAEQERILVRLQQSGYPFPSLVKRTVTLDRSERRVDVLLEFDPGASAIFGDFVVEGLESVNEQYMQRQIPWSSGEKYDVTILEDFEKKLLESGLFGAVHAQPQYADEQTNAVPIKISVMERDKRTIRLGVNYSDIGPGAKVLWEHRNLFGSGEHLETSVAYNPIEFLANARLERPGFFRANQALILDVAVSRESPDAYDADALWLSAVVRREFTRSIMAGTGLRYKYSRVEQLDRDDRFSHVIFPLMLHFDTRDDKLNPVKGSQLFSRTGYFIDTGRIDSFLKTELEGRLYQMLWKRPRLSCALRCALGTIEGAAVANIPADERFYAGGGGSIRGYEYQAVGPQVDGTPVGGSQLVEYSLELRVQPRAKLGFAAFVDGGTVYNGLASDADRTLRHGAGVGLRYFTGIGPLRADVAYPLNPADEHVERVQFYISLGQAF
jgi:translocation and assembly module TamA